MLDENGAECDFRIGLVLVISPYLSITNETHKINHLRIDIYFQNR